MDVPEERSLGAARRDVPDPRRPRGQRHAWPLRLTLRAAALARGQRRGRAIGHWVDAHAEALVAALAPPRGRLPSPATRRRAVRTGEVVAVAARLAAFAAGLAGGGVTMDAQVAQRALARQLRAQHGHSLMIATANQPAVPATIAGGGATTTRPEPGHGRLATRTLDRPAARNGALDWPAVGPVLRRACRRVIVKTGASQEEAPSGVTSRPIEALAAAVEGVWRGHGTTENRGHDVRDVTWGEDAGQQRVGHAPQALAARRTALLSVLRVLGWASSADARRHSGAAPHRALHLLATSPPRL